MFTWPLDVALTAHKCHKFKTCIYITRKHFKKKAIFLVYPPPSESDHAIIIKTRAPIFFKCYSFICKMQLINSLRAQFTLWRKPVQSQ